MERTALAHTGLSERRLRAIYEHIPLMYFTLDREGTVVSVNTHGAEQLGYEPEELIGASVLGVFHEEDKDAVATQLADVLERPGEVARWEFRKVRKDGSMLWVHEAVRAVETEDGKTLVLVVCEDITEQKRVREQLLQHERRLRELTREVARTEESERRRISIGLHDEIGQTLAVAKARIRQLEAEGGPADAQRLKEVRRLLEETIRSTRTLTFELSSPVLYELGLEAALKDLVGRLAAEGDVSFRFEADDRPKHLSQETEIVLFRAVRELARNVAHHAEANDAMIRMRRDRDRLHILVEDDGVGFDPEAIDGQRLGLFNVREQLEHVGARIQIDSAPGRGTRILVVAPLGDPETDEA